MRRPRHPLQRVAFALCVCLGVACVQPTPQPEGLPSYLLQKSMFKAEGEWWMNRTIVDVPYQATFTWLGNGDYPDRVRFRIEESWLIAYRSLPVIVGGGPDTQGLNDYEAPAAIWPIKRHFDVVAGQIVDSPRKAWWDKEWFEVDWAQDLSGNFRFGLTDAEAAPREAPAYIVMDPTDPDAPIFQPDYIDFTTHLTFRASLGEDPEQQKKDFCSQAAAATIVDAIDCTALNIAFRMSLRKIPADHDYETKYIDRVNRMNAQWFGRFFRNGRLVIDDQYGLVDNSGAIVLSRFNLWEKSLGEDGRPMPLTDRAIRLIPFHVSENFPKELVPLLVESLAPWDEVFRDTVQEARAWECVDGGGDYESCKASAERPDKVLTICPNNPVKRGDPEYCGAPGTRVRLGDQRYYLVHWNDTPSMLGLLGVGWWIPDMTTGEIYSAHMNVWPSAVDEAAAFARDSVLLAQGRLAPDELVDGLYADQMSTDLQTFAANPYASLVGLPPSPPRVPPADDELMSPADSSSLPNVVDDTMLGSVPEMRNSALAPILGTPEETMGLDWESLVLAGLDPTAPLDEETIALASPLRRPYVKRETVRNLVSDRLAALGADVDFPTDLEIAPSVAEMQDATPEEIYEEIRNHYLKWIFVHEFGHILGMRHNFNGSYDALNFPKEYWDLRNDGDARPRYQDPMTAAERDGHIDQFATSSVMDYFSTPLGTPVQLGKFDEMAVYWAYGGLVQVFDRQLDDDQQDVVEHLWKWPPLAATPTWSVPDPSGLYGHRHTGIHYTDLPSRLGDLEARAWVPVTHLRDDLGWGFDSVDEQGRVVVPSRACAEDLADFSPSCLRYDRGADQYEILSSTVNWFEAYYMLNSFRRGRTDFRAETYVAAMRSRFLTPIFDIHSAWLHMHWEFEPEAFQDDHFLGPMTKGIDMTFEYLARLIAKPEPGDYYPRDRPDGPILLASRAFDPHVNPDSYSVFHTAFEQPPDPATKVMSLPLGVGRIYRSIDINDGRNRLVLANVGSAIDKELALETLIEPQYFLFPGRGTWEDPRVWMVSWTKSHRTQMLDLIGSIAAGDVSRIAPVWTGTELKYRTFLDPQSNVSAEGTAVSPAIGFNLRIRAIIFGMALLAKNSSDRTFLDMSRIVISGGADDAITTDPTVEFTDQLWTGKTYKATSRLIDGIEMGIGYRMLQRAQVLQDGYLAAADATAQHHAEQALRDQLDLVEITRALVRRFDEHEYDYWTIQDEEP